ncbi:hypothetical protein [Reyranella sp.]|uniref:hypothetical protein n=2 Tax=Reyranella sp. TaxID=1929291 RepID=UPI003D113B65
MGGFQMIVAQGLKVAVVDDAGNEKEEMRDAETDGDERVEPRPATEMPGRCPVRQPDS